MWRFLRLVTCTLFATSAFAAQVYVTNTSDSGPGSLRDAITIANNPSLCAASCEIVFDLGVPSAGYWTIQPLTPLPAITADGVRLNGWTQTMNGGDTNPLGPEIVLDGSYQGSTIAGLMVHGSDVLIAHLALVNFRAWAVWVGSPGPPATDHVVIAENYIGVEATGVSAAGNHHPLRIIDSTDSSVVNNVISGNGDGVIVESSRRINFGLNKIGTNATQTALLPNFFGIRLSASVECVIESNVIAGHSVYAAISVDPSGPVGSTSTANSIRRNQMYGNLHGIDLFGNGPTANDMHDLDPGPNDLQNYPDLSVARGTLYGHLDSTPNTLFEVEIYSADSAKAYEGHHLLMTVAVTTSSRGYADFALPVPAGVAYITATATDMTTHNTSEFAPPVAAPVEWNR